MKDWVTDQLIWCIKTLNKTKDRRLACILHHLADQYELQPTGEWQWEAEKFWR